MSCRERTTPALLPAPLLLKFEVASSGSLPA
jgi:hypothetical protein